MYRSKSNIFIFIILLFAGLSVVGQSKSDLEQKKKKLKEEIEYTNKLLNETKKNKDLTIEVLVNLNKKILTREEIIATINSEIRLLDKMVARKLEIVEALEKDLVELKEEYAKMIFYSYKNRSSYNRLMFVFSASNFNEAYKRLKYLQQYTSYRRRQADLIAKTKESISRELAELKEKMNEKQRLLNSKQYERNQLTGEKKQKENVVIELKTKEKDLLKDLKRKEINALVLQKAIEKMIAEELAKEKERLANLNKGTSTSSDFPMTPEAQKLSNSFTANKGKLPWPVEQGVVTGKFGKQKHPVLDIWINNNGVIIGTSEGETARAVFDGVVTKVFIIPGEGKSVMIRHGEYITVYSFLSTVYVTTGDKVTTKQKLGVLVTDKANNSTTIDFQLWKGNSVLNPEYWIYRR